MVQGHDDGSQWNGDPSAAGILLDAGAGRRVCNRSLSRTLHAGIQRQFAGADGAFRRRIRRLQISRSEQLMVDIEHVVVLMLENRSFDCMLGRLYPNDPDYRGLTL